MLWTTKYIDAAVAQLKAEGHELRDEDIARLSPLKHRNLNVLGRYSFTASTPAAGALRPLRDPEAAGGLAVSGDPCRGGAPRPPESQARPVGGAAAFPHIRWSE
ncbi:putative Transposase for transposon [Streptomyces aurantiacus JA 4570]|uniref:Putative Transposase for transposon n=1 Tax=Streptomyces aurantiacus JA 4570 TaxID=1286094 RepID=S3ZU00_9ACTN|nr:putative Transposase for transposon [Streptomyces aurantiacus JA 4570]